MISLQQGLLAILTFASYGLADIPTPSDSGIGRLTITQPNLPAGTYMIIKTHTANNTADELHPHGDGTTDFDLKRLNYSDYSIPDDLHQLPPNIRTKVSAFRHPHSNAPPSGLIWNSTNMTYLNPAPLIVPPNNTRQFPYPPSICEVCVEGQFAAGKVANELSPDIISRISVSMGRAANQTSLSDVTRLFLSIPDKYPSHPRNKLHAHEYWLGSCDPIRQQCIPPQGYIWDCEKKFPCLVNNTICAFRSTFPGEAVCNWDEFAIYVSGSGSSKLWTGIKFLALHEHEKRWVDSLSKIPELEQTLMECEAKHPAPSKKWKTGILSGPCRIHRGRLAMWQFERDLQYDAIMDGRKLPHMRVRATKKWRTIPQAAREFQAAVKVAGTTKELFDKATEELEKRERKMAWDVALQREERALTRVVELIKKAQTDSMRADPIGLTNAIRRRSGITPVQAAGIYGVAGILPQRPRFP